MSLSGLTHLYQIALGGSFIWHETEHVTSALIVVGRKQIAND